MGVIFKSKFVYFQTPRCASNAVQDALLAVSSGNRCAAYHDWTLIGQHMDRLQLNAAWPGYKTLPGMCIIRNPFDILASHFVNFGSHKSIRSMVKHENHKDYTHNGLLCYHVPFCKYLIRWEGDMLKQINAVLTEFDCILRLAIPKINVTKDRKDYREYYTQADIDAVMERFGEEIKLLEYSFE
ncbi:MAG: hypothetical protein QQN63_00540 [Nitrosopumilus sp.]